MPFGRRPPVGAPPGTLLRDPEAQDTEIRLLCYGDADIAERPYEGAATLQAMLQLWPMTWIQVSGLRNIELLAELGRALGLHELALEDAVGGLNRPKVEDYDDYTFVILQAPPWHPTHVSAGEGAGGAAGCPPAPEQIAVFFGCNFVLSIEAVPTPRFDALRERLYRQRGRIRRAGPGYLVYAMLDMAVDEYFPLVETYGERLEELEAEVVRTPDRRTVRQIQELRRALLALRRSVWPLREVAYALAREGVPHVGRKTRVYLRDCADHLTQLIEITEMYRELTTGLLDIYLSSASARTNEVMRVLTIIATIFIPLSTVASIYGMNFNPQVSPWNMPELDWYYGYPYALLLMAGIAGAMLYFFRRKGWLGRSDPATLGDED